MLILEFGAFIAYLDFMGCNTSESPQNTFCVSYPKRFEPIRRILHQGEVLTRAVCLYNLAEFGLG